MVPEPTFQQVVETFLRLQLEEDGTSCRNSGSSNTLLSRMSHLFKVQSSHKLLFFSGSYTIMTLNYKHSTKHTIWYMRNPFITLILMVLVHK